MSSAPVPLCGGVGIEERLHDRRQALGAHAELEVVTVIDVKLAVRDQPVHDPRVDQRDDRVVVPGQDQRRRPQPAQPRQAGPADAGGQLVVVASSRVGPCRGVQQLASLRSAEPVKPESAA